MIHYTTIEQSKKLVELGLKPESADMSYTWNFDDSRYEMTTTPVKKWIVPKYAESTKIQQVLPCWSLGALLEVMPPYLFEFKRGIDLNIYRNLNGKGWHVSYMPNNTEDMQKDGFKQITNGETPIEAAYNMVVWLLENGYLQSYDG